MIARPIPLRRSIVMDFMRRFSCLFSMMARAMGRSAIRDSRFDRLLFHFLEREPSPFFFDRRTRDEAYIDPMSFVATAPNERT